MTDLTAFAADYVMPKEPELRALRAALKTDPGDDTARLVLADWCDENGRAGEARHHRLAVAVRRAIERPDDQAPRLAYARVARDYGDYALAGFVEAQVTAERAPEYDPARRIAAAAAVRILGANCADDDGRTNRDKWSWPYGALHGLRGAVRVEFRMGMADELRLPHWNYWPDVRAHLWRPDWMTVCGGCLGHGKAVNSPNQYPCRLCFDAATGSGTGAVPRPFVPSARPVRRVIFETGRPLGGELVHLAALGRLQTTRAFRGVSRIDLAVLGRDAGRQVSADTLAKMCEAAWPGVSFEFADPAGVL